jgi:hypothetical protein
MPKGSSFKGRQLCKGAREKRRQLAKARAKKRRAHMVYGGSFKAWRRYRKAARA